MLKAPGARRLILYHDYLLSSFAFKFDSRRYTVAVDLFRYMAGRCRLTLFPPTLKAPGTKRLKLKYDAPLSKFAFKFNLRRYNTESFQAATVGARPAADAPLWYQSSLSWFQTPTSDGALWYQTTMSWFQTNGPVECRSCVEQPH